MKLHPNASVAFEVTLTLTETEARALDALTDYGTDAFLKCFYAHLGSGNLRPHEPGLRSLFEVIVTKLRPHLSSVNSARRMLSSDDIERERERLRAELREARDEIERLKTPPFFPVDWR